MKEFGLKISDNFKINLFDHIDTVRKAIQILKVKYYSNISLEQEAIPAEQLADVSVVIMSNGANLEIKLTNGEVTHIRSYESKLNSINIDTTGINPVELMKVIKEDIIQRFELDSSQLRLIAYDVKSNIIRYSTPYLMGEVEIEVIKGRYSWYIETIHFVE